MPADIAVASRGSKTATDEAVDIVQSRARLDRLDLWEWFRWASVLFIALLLTGGMFSLSMPMLRRDWLSQGQLNINIWGLLGLVLLFGAYTVYQQLLITRLRRDMTSRIGMAATLEVLKPPPQGPEPGHTCRRHWERFHLDLRITVEAVVRGRPAVIYGRTSDISEGGLGAVIPESLSPDDEINIRLPIGRDAADVTLRAVVRHRRGFYHGCEFFSVSEEDRAAIRAACEGAVPVLAYRRDYRPPAEVGHL